MPGLARLLIKPAGLFNGAGFDCGQPASILEALRFRTWQLTGIFLAGKIAST